MSEDPPPTGTTGPIRELPIDGRGSPAPEDAGELFETVRRVKRQLLSLWELYDTIAEEQARLHPGQIEPLRWGTGDALVSTDDGRAPDQGGARAVDGVHERLGDLLVLRQFLDLADVRAAAAMLEHLSHDLATLRLLDDEGFRAAWEHTVFHLRIQEEITRFLTGEDVRGAAGTGPATSGHVAGGPRHPYSAGRSGNDDVFLDLTETLFTWLARRVSPDALRSAKSIVLAASSRCDALARRLSRLQDHGLRLDISDAELGALEDRVRLDLLERRVESQAREIELLRKVVFELNDERLALAEGARERRTAMLAAETAPDIDM